MITWDNWYTTNNSHGEGTNIMTDIKDSDFETIAKSLEKNLERSAGKSHQIASFNDLFSSSFMTCHTQFSTFKELLDTGKFDVKSLEDFNSILNSKFDEYISKTTKFQNWEEMQSNAVAEYFKKEL